MADKSSGEGLFDSLDPDRRAEFNGYYLAHEKGLRRCASRKLEDSGMFPDPEARKEVARYCAQEAFMKLLIAMCQGTKPFLTASSDPKYVKNWLYEVTENFAGMKIRAMRLRVEKLPPPVSLDVLHDVQGLDVASEENLEEHLADSLDIKSRVDDLMSQLNPTEAKVIRLKYEEYTSDEIGAITGMLPATVRQRQSRALEKLKKRHNRE